ncbi:metallophosphoesterase [Lutimonas sp.]|uniref:metallophosphoesterase n=1 Tax=Lutimonas sp. TaxID=1872403 RepID=UPI003D9B934F
MNKKKTTYAIYCFTLTLTVLLVTGFSYHTNKTRSHTQSGLHYEGTYALYAQKTTAFNFRWITPVEDVGRYEVLDKNNKLIVSGETAASRTHQIDLDQAIKGPFTFKFGGVNEGMHKVHIRKNFKLESTDYKKTDSIYVVGDVHGRYDEMIALLKNSKVIDQDLNWMAGSAHIVFLGDIFDRGNDVTKVLWFIYSLEEKAAEKGGKVHLVLGNHEIMTMTKDLRYLSRKERNIAIAHGLSYDKLFHPIDSYLGAWLRTKVSILKIDQIVFAHGGVLDLGPFTLESFNKQAFDYMKDPIYLDLMQDAPDTTKYEAQQWFKMRDFFYYENGPYWYRGYVKYDTLGPQLDAMLDKHKSKIHVVAHTPLETITQRYDGKLLTTDLKEAATELLLLERKKNKYKRFKIDSDGVKTEL